MEENSAQQPAIGTQSNASRNIVYSLIGIAIIVIVAELVWAYGVVQKSSGILSYIPLPPTKQTAQSESVVDGSISLRAPKQVLKLGDKLTVTAYISSNNHKTDGTDVVISYDPKILRVETIGPEKKVMAVSDIYSEYPSNNIDGNDGTLKISGISNILEGNAVNGVLGSIIFSAKGKGKTAVVVQYSPGETTESNMVETTTGKDLLGKVENLEVEVK